MQAVRGVPLRLLAQFGVQAQHVVPVRCGCDVCYLVILPISKLAGLDAGLNVTCELRAARQCGWCGTGATGRCVCVLPECGATVPEEDEQTHRILWLTRR